MSAIAVSFAGIFVVAIGTCGSIAPQRLTSWLATWPVLTRLWVTVGLRTVFGVVFLLVAPKCRLPDLVRVVGVIELISAATLLALGSARLERLVAWWLARPPSFIRRWCAFALVFGVVLVYAGA